MATKCSIIRHINSQIVKGETMCLVICKVDDSKGRTTEFEAETLQELIEQVSYTLLVGREYQHEDGNYHIPLDREIETVDDLIEALNDATHNRHSGYAPYYWM